MEGFYLLCAHLLGDYILQNDWMAKNKANRHPGPAPDLRPARDYPGPWSVDANPADTAGFAAALAERNEKILAWDANESVRVLAASADRVEWLKAATAWRVGLVACLVHCLLYTLAVWVLSWWWMPLWGLAVCFAAHYALDHYRLARKWMTLVGQEEFATGPLAPWSVVAVDNTFHVLTLAGIAMASGLS